MSENDLQSFAPKVGRMKSKRWVQASAPSYDGDDWDDDYYSGDDAPEVPEVPSEHVPVLPEVHEEAEHDIAPVIKPLALGRAGQQQKLEEERAQKLEEERQRHQAALLEQQYQAKLAEEKRQREQLEELEREQERIREARLKKEQEAQEEAERVEREEIEREYRERQEAEQRRQAEAEQRRQAKLDAEREAKEAAEREAKLEAEREAKAEEERLAKIEAERVAKVEAERAAKAEAERLAKAEAERQAQLEKERAAEKARKAKIEKAREEAEAQAKAEAAARKAEEERLAEEKRVAEEKRLEEERLAAEEKAKEAARVAALEAELEAEREKESKRQEAVRLAEKERQEAEREAEYQTKLEARAKEAEKARHAEEEQREAEQARLEAERHALLMSAAGEEEGEKEGKGFYDSRGVGGVGVSAAASPVVASPRVGYEDFGASSPRDRDPYDPSNHSWGGVNSASDEGVSGSHSGGIAGVAAGVAAAAGVAGLAASHSKPEDHTIGLSKEALAKPTESDASLKHASTIANVGETPVSLPGSTPVSLPGSAGSSSHARVDSVEDIVADYYAYSSDEENVEEGSTMDEPKEEKESQEKESLASISPVSSTSHSHYADAEDVEAGYTMDGQKLEGSDGSDHETDHDSDGEVKPKPSKIDTSLSHVPDTSDVQTPKLEQGSTSSPGKREIPHHLVPGITVTGHPPAASEITPTSEMNKLSDEILNSFSAEGADPYYTNSAYDYDDSDAGADAELHALYAGSQKFLEARMSRDMSDVHGDYSSVAPLAPLSPKRMSKVALEEDPSPEGVAGGVAAVAAVVGGTVGVAAAAASSTDTTSAAATPTSASAPTFDKEDLSAKQTEPLPSLPSIPASLDPGTPSLDQKEDDKEERSSSPELDEFEDAVERIPTNDDKPDRTSHDSGYKSMILATSLENVANTPSSRSASRGGVGKQGSISSMNALGKTDSSSSSGVPTTTSSAIQSIFPTNSVSTGSPAQAPASFAKQATTTAVLPKGPAITTAQVRSGPSYDFRSILTRPRSVDRSNAFNDARKREAEYSPGLESWLVFTYNALKTDAGISDMQTSGSYSGGSINLPKASSNILAGSIGDVFQNPLSGMSGATKVSEKSSQVFNKVGESTTKRARGLFAKSKKLMKGDR